MATVQSIERAFSVLRALAVAPAGVSELAAQADLPKSTVSRLLATMEGLGVVERELAGYRIGRGITELAGSTQPAELVKPHLERLARTLGETAGFSVPEGLAVRYLVQAEGPNPVQVRDYSGLEVPAHVVPSGLVMMAHWPRDQLREYLRRPLEAYTAKTVVEPRLVDRRLGGVRTTGSAWCFEEYSEGISSVASAVLDSHDRVIGAIHVHGPSYRFPGKSDQEKIAAAVRDAARVFSQRV